MNVTINKRNQAGPLVPADILGQNIEMCLTTADGLLSDRLRNPKFTGPPHRMSGVAPDWQGASCGRGFYELAPGSGLMGAEAQLIRMPAGNWNPALHQNRVPVRAGEELELEIWARAWHQPVPMRIELRPLASRSAVYDQGELTIDTSWFKRYTLPLKASRDDDEARLVMHLPQGGDLWIDQVHLRPRGEALLCREVIEEMARMRIPTLRFPGGIVCNAYNWRHGTGPVHLRPAMLEAAFHQDWHLNYDFGLDEYIELCLQQGINPALTLNVATGTPDEAAEMAAYVAGRFGRAGVEPPLVDWHIANHPYALTTAHMSPAMYADVLDAFVPAVKAHYPRCRIVAVMSGGGLTSRDDAWKDMLFSKAALIDVVQVQLYGGCDPRAEPAAQSRALTDALVNYEQQLRAFIAEGHARGADWQVGVAEWNWWHQASHWDGRAFEEPPTALHGLFIAGMIHRYAALAPDFAVAQFYNLVNCMGILNHRGADVEVTDAVAVFKLYRPALPGRLMPLEITVDGAEPPDWMDAVCLVTDEADWLFLANRDIAQSVRVSLDGCVDAGADVEALTAASTLGGFTPCCKRLDGGTLVLPPLSIIRIQQPRR